MKVQSNDARIDFASDDLTSELEMAVQCRLAGRIGRFCLTRVDGGVILRGYCRSYHAKQLAQHEVMQQPTYPSWQTRSKWSRACESVAPNPNDISSTSKAAGPPSLSGCGHRAVHHALPSSRSIEDLVLGSETGTAPAAREVMSWSRTLNKSSDRSRFPPACIG